MDYMIREITSSDLENVTALCTAAMTRDLLNENLMSQKIFDDPDFDSTLTLLACSSDKLIGFAMAVIRDRENYKQAYIKFIATHPHFTRQGIALSLYKNIENKLIQRGIKSIRLFECWSNYYIPGLDPFYTEAVCFFERLGFKKIGDTSNLAVQITDNNYSTETNEAACISNGIEIRRASAEDFDQLMDWIHKNFKLWKGEVEAAFKNDPVSLHLALISNEIIAFSAYDTNNIGLGWFGPMGTTEAARGKGLGGILLKICIADMQKKGYKKAIIPWVGPIPFYMHYINSKVDRVFWRYEKKLEL